jgi:hypothetical protein
MYIRKPILVIIILFAAAATAFAQAETLTNNDIVEMTKAGLPAVIVAKKIRTSNTKFDITAAGLIELKKANVADEILTLMIERQEIVPPNQPPDNTPAYSESGSTPNASATPSTVRSSTKEILASARTIAFAKSSTHPSRQALEKELLKRKDFQQLNLAIERYKDTADLYVEIGFVHGSLITHRYVYRVYDRRSGAVIAAGETTSWGSLAENLARNIARSLSAVREGRSS